MEHEGGESRSALGGVAAYDRSLVLAFSFARTRELGQAVASVLGNTSQFQFAQRDFPDADEPSLGPMLASCFAQMQPNVLVVCLAQGLLLAAKSIFDALHQTKAEPAVVAILERSGLEMLQALLDLGIADYCLAPISPDDLVPRLLRWQSPAPNHSLTVAELTQKLGLRHFIGESPVFLQAIQHLPRLAKCPASVLITGETGTGKEMFARAIHHLGARSKAPFIAVNCGAIPPELVENEMFGHAAGAFTGASSSMGGLVREAEGGTLFLDEVDSLPLTVQVKLLRLLQEKEYRPLGAQKLAHSDLRVIAASGTDLEAAVASGRFRADLFYRLNVLPLRLPSLRERREDIPVLARHFIEKFSRELAMPRKYLSRSALEKLRVHQWPGNVRELENVIERAMVLSDGACINAENIILAKSAPGHDDDSFKALKAKVIANFETDYLRRLLADCDGNVTKAAQVAKKNRRAFWQLLRKYGIGPALPSAPPNGNGQFQDRQD